MAKKEIFSEKEVISAIKKANGYVSKAASILGCTARTVYNYRDRYDAVADAWNSIREARHDEVETALHDAIKAGNVTAIIFYLKTQARERGYIEKREIAITSWQDEIIHLIKDGMVDYGSVESELGEDLAQELFAAADVEPG